MVGEIIKSYFEEVYVVGNIGNPYTDIVSKTNENSITIIELSSFQLETVHEFKPDISLVLNITPDHLDRHHTMDNYIKMKENIAMNQGSSELCILNYEDPILRKDGKSITDQSILFW